MTFELPNLPYAYDALEPYIDATTMEIHYTKHHAGYTAKFNAALEGTEYENKDILRIMQNIENLEGENVDAIRNNGGGYYNHNLFWENMTPNGNEMSEFFTKKLIEEFGGVNIFKNMFEKAAATRFGSGRAWLVKDMDGELTVISTPNQDNPLARGQIPLLTLDIREHAYYLKYQNKRPEYISNRWNVVNWEEVEARYNG